MLVDLTMEAQPTQINTPHALSPVAVNDDHDLALVRGQVLFRGSPAELISSANGHVWTLTTDKQEKPNHDMTVVSMMHLSEGTQYRLVGASAATYPQAQAAQPGLEDGYVWLMKNSGHEVE
jgi:ABC-2 type transport system ATP-binding protein